MKTKAKKKNESKKFKHCDDIIIAATIKNKDGKMEIYANPTLLSAIAPIAHDFFANQIAYSKKNKEEKIFYAYDFWQQDPQLNAAINSFATYLANIYTSPKYSSRKANDIINLEIDRFLAMIKSLIVYHWQTSYEINREEIQNFDYSKK